MMIKILSTVLLALLLTACGSDDKAETKTFNTEKHTDSTTPATLEELEKKVTTTPHIDTKQAEPKTAQEPTKQTQETAPEKLVKDIFQLTTLDGKTLHVDEAKDGIIFQEHKGKVVFLLFFGYRCPPCLEEIPTLKALSAQKHKDLEIIAMEVQRLPKEQLKMFQKEKGINYTLLSGDEGNNAQFISYIGQRARWGGSIPFLVGINPHGEVKMVHVGGMEAEDFQAIYKKLALEK